MRPRRPELRPETALLNLAVNARDAMAEGGQLIIATRRDQSHIVIEVRDTGVGMSPEVRDRVFEPFFTTKEVGKGSGLGLSQVYGFVRQSEGEVQLSSTVGQGTTFTLRLPVSEEPDARTEPEAPAVTVEGGRERILVVEDDPTVLTLTLDMLSGLGYQVVTATNASDASKILAVVEGAVVDLLFSDVVMLGGASKRPSRTARDLRRWPARAVDLRLCWRGRGAGDQGVPAAGQALRDPPPVRQAAQAARPSGDAKAPAPRAAPPRNLLRGRGIGARSKP